VAKNEKNRVNRQELVTTHVNIGHQAAHVEDLVVSHHGLARVRRIREKKLKENIEVKNSQKMLEKQAKRFRVRHSILGREVG
jgi:hypothetical protein